MMREVMGNPTNSECQGGLARGEGVGPPAARGIARHGPHPSLVEAWPCAPSMNHLAVSVVRSRSEPRGNHPRDSLADSLIPGVSDHNCHRLLPHVNPPPNATNMIFCWLPRRM